MRWILTLRRVFLFLFFNSKKLGARLSLYPFPPSPASPAAAASPPTLASSWEYIYVCICVCTCEVNEQLFFNPRASTHKNYWFSPRTSPTHGRPCFLSWPTYMPPTRALTISTIPRLRRKRPTTPIVLGPYLPTYQTSRNRSPNQMAIRVTLPRLFSPKYSRTEVDDGALMVCS